MGSVELRLFQAPIKKFGFSVVQNLIGNISVKDDIFHS